MKHLGGSKSDAWNLLLCNQTIQSAWFSENMSDAEKQEEYTAILAFLAGVKPADPVEGMMAGQLYASHASAMDCYRRAMLPGQSIETKQILLTLATKLTKANAAQVEALKKHGATASKRSRSSTSMFMPASSRCRQCSPGGSRQKYGGSTLCCWICRTRRGAVR
jgi:hypothetical protein